MKPLKLDDGESRIAENAFREKVGNQEKEEGEPKTFPPSWAWILSVQQSYFPALRPPPARTLVLSAIMGGTSAGQAEGSLQGHGWMCFLPHRWGWKWPPSQRSDQIQTLPLSPRQWPCWRPSRQPIDPRPRRRAFEIRPPLPGPAPCAPMVSFPNPLHSNGFRIF